MSAAEKRFHQHRTSPLSGVSDEAWRAFVAALTVQPLNVVSESGGLGQYAIRPRRLVELGYATSLRSVRTPSGRQIQVCDFVLPRTPRHFLASEFEQHAAFVKSIAKYRELFACGRLKCPRGVSLAGALAILHCGGYGALRGWPKLFDETRALYEVAHKMF